MEQIPHSTYLPNYSVSSTQKTEATDSTETLVSVYQTKFLNIIPVDEIRASRDRPPRGAIRHCATTGRRPVNRFRAFRGPCCRYTAAGNWHPACFTWRRTRLVLCTVKCSSNRAYSTSDLKVKLRLFLTN
jgi:hypothetical protein